MHTTLECQTLFNEFVEFISHKNDIHVGEIKKNTPTKDIDDKVRELEISYENDSSILIKVPGHRPIPYDCRHLGFRDSQTRAWKFFIEVVSSNDHQFNFGPAYEYYSEGTRKKRAKIKHYDARWKLCDEVCKRLRKFFAKEFGWVFPKDYKLYERNLLGPEGERRFKFQISNPNSFKTSPAVEDTFSELEELDLLSEIQKFQKEYMLTQESEDDIPVELFAALKVGQEKFGWPENHFKEMIGWPEKYEEEIVYEEKIVAK